MQTQAGIHVYAGSLSHWVSPDAVVFGLTRQSVGWALPGTEGLGLVVVHIHWPVPGHVQYIKHRPVPGGEYVHLRTYVHDWIWEIQHFADSIKIEIFCYI